jgi:hypothetical protein
MGTAHVLLKPETIARLRSSPRYEVNILSESVFGDDLIQVHFSSPRLRDGYNGQVELSFVPWPDGELRIKRDHDT